MVKCRSARVLQRIFAWSRLNSNSIHYSQHNAVNASGINTALNLVNSFVKKLPNIKAIGICNSRKTNSRRILKASSSDGKLYKSNKLLLRCYYSLSLISLPLSIRASVHWVKKFSPAVFKSSCISCSKRIFPIL